MWEVWAEEEGIVRGCKKHRTSPFSFLLAAFWWVGKKSFSAFALFCMEGGWEDGMCVWIS